MGLPVKKRMVTAVTDKATSEWHIFCWKVPERAVGNMFRSLRVSRKGFVMALLGLAALVAMRSYYVEEMLAALALFTVLFGCAEALLLLLYGLDRVGGAAVEFIELRMRELLQHARGFRNISEPRTR